MFCSFVLFFFFFIKQKTAYEMGTFFSRYKSIILGLFVFFIDFFTKRLALDYCLMRCEISQFLSFKISFNRGMTGSLFHTSNTLGFVLVTGMVIAITIGLSYYAYKR